MINKKMKGVLCFRPGFLENERVTPVPPQEWPLIWDWYLERWENERMNEHFRVGRSWLSSAGLHVEVQCSQENVTWHEVFDMVADVDDDGNYPLNNKDVLIVPLRTGVTWTLATD